jgi:hypothetical protein
MMTSVSPWNTSSGCVEHGAIAEALNHVENLDRFFGHHQPK